ncbi:hypothetical protein MKW94_016742 [Papaver nudicaule]|uniref:H15 domain-containing protein n=1 Tax=Papaver nudicaule TaxID=74823 RepID=A0AA41VS43_PAPNU|nr:hypothetical protein [Papaver nudicaule]
MIIEAISSLKERTGSSQRAIAKFIEEKYVTGLPSNFKKIISMQLKKFVKFEKLVKVKNSYKISVTEKSKNVVVTSGEVKEKKEKKAKEIEGEGEEKKRSKKSEKVVVKERNGGYKCG